MFVYTAPRGGWARQPLEDDYPVIADFETSGELNINYTGRASNASISTHSQCFEWVLICVESVTGGFQLEDSRRMRGDNS